MRFVSAALPARRSFPTACAAAPALPSAWADPDPDPATRHPRDARATSHAPSPTTLTTDFDSTLTPAQPSRAVGVSAVPARTPDTAGVVGTVERDLIDARNFVASADAIRYAPHLLIRKRFTSDRNSVIARRDFNELHSERAHLAYADGLLLSNLPDSRYAYPPRGWPIEPDDIGQIDAPAGPLVPLGSDNLTDRRYPAFHPNPRRTFRGELKWSL
jgi:iron complex outermembrane receptor protein